MAMHAPKLKLIFFFAILAIISIASARSPSKALSWGFNTVGELGSGSSTIGKIITKPSPINTTIFGSDIIQDICCGENFCVALSGYGSLYSWGDNTIGELGDGSGINQPSPVRVKTNSACVQISCGQGHVLAVTDKGQVLAWGWNMRGQVAANMDSFMVPTPQRISFFDQNNLVIEKVAAGYQHSMALTKSGKVYTWGDNSMGQLGIGRNSDQPFSNVPNLVSTLPKNNVIKIGTGQDHAFAVYAYQGNVALFAWGDNRVGQLGTGSISEPVYLPTRANITGMNNMGILQVTGGAAHSLAISSSGNIFVWGANTFGQLGLSDKIDRHSPTLLTLPNGETAQYVSGGMLHSLVVDDDGDVWAFGGNSSGQCGDGDQQDLEEPVKILPKSSAFTAVASKYFSASLGKGQN